MSVRVAIPEVETNIRPAAFSGKVPQRESRTDEFVRTHAAQIALALSVYAALRILVFTAAFPLFNNVDEKFHFMSIEMYAEGHLPGKTLPLIDDKFSRTFLPYWSPEYDSPEVLERYGIVAPIYPLQAEASESALTHGYYPWKRDRWSRTPNFEAQAAPLYYLVGAAWYKLGTVFDLQGWRLAYWLRLLSPVGYGVFVWLSYKFVLRVYPERRFLHVAVPALLAVFPNDVFFGLNRDVLSPVLGASVLLMLAESLDGKGVRSRPLLIAAFLVGLAFTLEVSNCVFYGALAATLGMWMHRSRVPIARKIWIAGLSLAASLALPFPWLLRNYLVIGDLTGSREKLRWFGWTAKPLAEVFHHPLFTWQGSRYFLVHLTRDFWQGEIKWYGQPMQSGIADKFYILSTALLILIFAADFARRRKSLSDLERWTTGLLLFLIAASALFLAAISLPFDYHDFGYPSQLHPFFISGRIIFGSLLPFAVIYMSGLDLLLQYFRRWIPPVAVLACLLLFVTASEVRVRSIAFHSRYNLFSLSADAQAHTTSNSPPAQTK